MDATAQAPTRRDYTSVGREWTDTYGKVIEEEIDGLQWTTNTRAPMSPGIAITELIKQLRIPVADPPRYAINGTIEVPDGPERATYSIYGIEGHYKNATVRLYALDKGTGLIPLCVDVWELEAPPAPPARPVPDGWDWIDGQRYVQLPDGRQFAVVRARRWTRVHEYLSNGQLTARWFVDEATGEAREAEGWRKPRNWRLGGEAAAFARWVVDLANDPTGGV